MKLLHSTTSPYARKVLACAIAREIDGQIELVPTSGRASPPHLLSVNPLSKIPCLITEDGLALFDSPVICEYLDSVGDAFPMFPRPGSPARWIALKQQALGDGLMDAGIGARLEQQRPPDDAREGVIARHLAALRRSVAALEADVPHQMPDIGSIAIACALGFLDFRFAPDFWRPQHPKLAAWFDEISAIPALARTVPVDA